MTVRHFFRGLWLGLALLPGLVMAQTIHPLQQAIDQLVTFQADFVQEQPEEHFFRVNRAFGEFYLARPGMMRWNYTRPDPQQILVDGRHLWVYEPELAQVTVQRVSEIQGDIPLAWLLFEEPIEQTYRIIDAGQRDGLTWYNLRPRRATFFQSIEVGLKDQQIHAVWMYQGATEVTKVTFSNIQQNQPIAHQHFELQLDGDVDYFGEF